jgi:hypothetical protein
VLLNQTPLVFGSNHCFFLLKENLRIRYCFFPSTISKLIGELNTGDLDEDLYCIEIDVDNTIVGSLELDKLARLARRLWRTCQFIFFSGVRDVLLRSTEIDILSEVQYDCCIYSVSMRLKKVKLGWELHSGI